MQDRDDPTSAPDPHFIDAESAAHRYGFSKRHWLRLVDCGRAPLPTRFGRLVRWSVTALESWEQDGCKPVRTVRAKGGASW
jgi:predicted DNA-binding transcriptional regulator AlpA